MQLRDIMTNNVQTVNPNSSVKDAATIMKNLNVGSVPVCEGKRAVGIITDRDIAIRNVANNGDSNTPVTQVMSKNMIYGQPDMSDQEAATLMAEKQIRRLPVVENDNLVGIVSLGDLAVNSRSDMEAGEALSTISKPSKPAK
ncbi:CBS domain-containing protein [Iocasia frigidifontis]|uniref:CBS domain-containing protein n=1 Tax=Iocasia fonsfrigidae TaxID=2682810 RepID=A0A8A7KC42_9FIRM|nr:CBS domain-containing protein [Iocasia fonsfrigidae]QTL97655.1 CBS domain-containing protein [Iocasia fonsfrigidae]